MYPPENSPVVGPEATLTLPRSVRGKERSFGVKKLRKEAESHHKPLPSGRVPHVRPGGRGLWLSQVFRTCKAVPFLQGLFLTPRN